MRESMRKDVAILGGGLAGLTLSLQLRQRFPDLDIVVLERRRHPVPEATHKVGESTVEIGANYLDTVLGLKEHLVGRQLKKFGFRFFFSEGRRDIDAVLEVGSSTYFATAGYQIDRGIFENFLAQRAREAGVEFVDGVAVREVDFAAGEEAHRVRCGREGVPLEIEARWVVDASGRAGILKRQLGLGLDNDHDVNSAWFRIRGRIDVNDWSSNPQWLGRCNPPNRWLSTIHLVGEGYWVWLIPLASGSHSVGIVADGRIHPLNRINSYERARAWLREFQPRLAEDLDSRGDVLQDFTFLKHFSHGCRKVFSGQRWAMTGESGVFLDPFYSPGTDFIAIANTYITELIAHDRAGLPVGSYALLYDQLFRSFCDSTMSLYLNQYALFGDPDVLPVKVMWDYTYYWGVLCQLYFQRRLTDLPMLSRLREELKASRDLNFAVQDLLRAWSAGSDRNERRNPPMLLDQAELGWFTELNRGLRDTLDDESLVARMQQGTDQLRQLAREIVAAAAASVPGVDVDPVMRLLGAPPAGSGARLLSHTAA